MHLYLPWSPLYFLKRMGYKNVKGKLYKGMRHDVLHEKRKMHVYEDILSFIEN